MFPMNGMHPEGNHFKLESNIWSSSLLWDVFMLCVWKINELMRELLMLCRCAKGSASPGYQGCHYAFTWWEQGGPPDSSLFPEWCHSCSEGKPDDTNKPCCLLSTFPVPLKHSQKREFFTKVCPKGAGLTVADPVPQLVMTCSGHSLALTLPVVITSDTSEGPGVEWLWDPTFCSFVRDVLNHSS